eukprot:12989825-Alexandrium_andersonii.AAC.1
MALTACSALRAWAACIAADTRCQNHRAQSERDGPRGSAALTSRPRQLPMRPPSSSTAGTTIVSEAL